MSIYFHGKYHTECGAAGLESDAVPYAAGKKCTVRNGSLYDSFSQSDRMLKSLYCHSSASRFNRTYFSLWEYVVRANHSHGQITGIRCPHLFTGTYHLRHTERPHELDDSLLSLGASCMDTSIHHHCTRTNDHFVPRTTLLREENS